MVAWGMDNTPDPQDPTQDPNILRLVCEVGKIMNELGGDLDSSRRES